jgi:hypothetical protein
MQIRRYCKRYYLSRTSMFLLTLFSTLSTMIIFQNIFSTQFIKQQDEIDKIYIF